jgi:hypothetical protein
MKRIALPGTQSDARAEFRHRPAVVSMFEKIPLDQLLAQAVSGEIRRVSDNQWLPCT